MSAKVPVKQPGPFGAFLQLIRFPNIFTAASNVAAAALLVSGGAVTWANLGLLVGCSILLYASGMIFNDYFDFAIDKAERPQRPLPSGQISRPLALLLGGLFMFAANALAWLVGERCGMVAFTLSGMILLYDGLLKQWLLPGALSMGLCRGLNWLLGLMLLLPSPILLLIPLGITLYIALLTALARQEVKRPGLKKIIIWGLTALPVLDGLIVILSGQLLGGLIIAGLVVPVLLLKRKFYMT